MATTKQIKHKNENGQEEIIDLAVNAENVENVVFKQASARANLKSGEKLPVIFGKLMKWFADLKPVAWSGSYADLSGKPSLGTLGGTVPVARGGTGATSASAARTNIGLGAAATYAVANNDTTNNASYLTTAAVAYQHGREIDALNSSLTAGLNGCKVSYEGGSFYAAYGGVKKKLGDLVQTGLSLSLLTSGNDRTEITAGPVDFTGQKFLKLIYDYNNSNREGLHIDIYSGGNTYLQKYLAKGYSHGSLTLHQNLESVIDVSGVSGQCYIRLWADNAKNSGGGQDGLGNFVVKSMVLYGS